MPSLFYAVSFTPHERRFKNDEIKKRSILRLAKGVVLQEILKRCKNEFMPF
ncbi:hypothetical protein [Campylobacter upsaliensis]|uniref:hypothetical protein n=1 Tax=Campylobacter upsaliensis TaxID=28080 RepID=UPI0022EB503F|nr:hypothetical protein [Campylobacter upsaliensis]